MRSVESGKTLTPWLGSPISKVIVPFLIRSRDSWRMIDLWLDDERDPENPQIQEIFGSCGGMVWVKTAFAAINRLKDGNVRSISFDHDLGPGLTGYDVAKWIEERAFGNEFGRIEWSVHSKNPRGSKAITIAMQQAEKFWAVSESSNQPMPNADQKSIKIEPVNYLRAQQSP